MTKIDVLLGLQWGDEGKGKIVDVLTPQYDIIARFQGGPNAGHTLEFNGMKQVLHLIPSGIFHKKTINVMGNGVVVDPYILKKELLEVISRGAEPYENLFISRKAHLIIPTHRFLDAAYEQQKGNDKIGSTLKGIGPTYTDKTARVGLRIGTLEQSSFLKQYNNLKETHLKILHSLGFNPNNQTIEGLSFEQYEGKWFEALENIKKLKFIDCEYFLNENLELGKKILAEGAQGSLLDIDYGSYPFVTSSNTTIGGVCTGLGVAPMRIGKVFGIFKAYCTRVGSGPFPTELLNEVGEKLRTNGCEFGSTTGRPRRCGWLDLPALNYAVMLNGVTDLIMTKPDVLDDFDVINICTSYEVDNKITNRLPYDQGMSKLNPVYDELKGWNTSLKDIKNVEQLPQKLIDYINYITLNTKCPITIVSTGPDRSQTLMMKKTEISTAL